MAGEKKHCGQSKPPEKALKINKAFFGGKGGGKKILN